MTSRVEDSPAGVQKMRTFAQIIADAREKRNILEIKIKQEVCNGCIVHVHNLFCFILDLAL